MKEILLCQFWQSCFKPHDCALAERKLKEGVAKTQSQNTRRLGIPAQHHKSFAFSLVEMLMALLVASLLLAALAPVMTKRMDEAKLNISGVGAAQYDKDAIIQIYTGSPDEDKVFNVPSDVNMIKATLIGGGGAGGNSFYGKQEVTTSKSWTVPDGVTKLRVFMLGGGGGGASGGLGTGTATIPAGGDGNTYKDFLTEGEHTFTIPSTATKVPDLDPACAASGKTAWTGVSDGKTYTPGKVAISVTACGGGGGGGGKWVGTGGGGGSGGYATNIQLTGTLSTIYIKVGGGGGGGGNGQCGAPSIASAGYGGGGGGGGGCSRPAGSSGTYGGTGSAGKDNNNVQNGNNGTNITPSSSYGGSGGIGAYSAGSGGRGGIWGGGGGGGGLRHNDSGSAAGGGGGGGPTTISTSSGTDETKIIFQIGGGGGGGGGGGHNDSSHRHAGGGGGGGGGYGGGGGGGGGGYNTAGSYGNAGIHLSSIIGINTGLHGKIGSINSQTFYGGGGGGAYGGIAGDSAGSNASGKIGENTIWRSNSYCDGGDGGVSQVSSSGAHGENGKPGALRLYYTYPALKCDYSLPANGSGGGGAGQIVVGEIDVTPGETLYFEIGAGGNTQSAAGKNGNAGYATNIRRGSASGTIIAQALGGFGGQYSSAETTPSYGGNSRPTVAIGSGNTISDNWTGTSFNANSNKGENGNLATAILNKGFGGAGGSSVNIKGETLQGGSGGNSVKNGASPDLKAYGAGGGGGAGSPVIGDTTFGIGASGASGYIYFEYGGTNGGGGTVGEMVTKLLTNIKGGTEIKINVGDGGDNATGDGSGKASSIEYQGGSTTKTLSARGGLRGNDGGMGIGEQAGVKMLPNTYANFKSDENAVVHGKGATETYGGIGGYIEELYQNPDNTWATYIKAKDGTIGGPVLGGCGGNLTTLMAGITCNDAANTPNGKNGTFGGGGGGGAVVNETGGLGGKGGRGMVIIEYKSTAL